MKRYYLLFAAFIMIANVNINGQLVNNATTSYNSNKSKVNVVDADFIKDAASGGMMEVELGKIAKQKALSTVVKNFGERMVKDHYEGNKKLKAVAKKLNLDIPAVMEKKNQSSMDKLIKKTGLDFDKDYIDMMVKDHKDDIAEFEKAENNVINSDLKQWITATLPILRKHLTDAQSIQDQLKNKK